jgi:hypothetical protein
LNAGDGTEAIFELASSDRSFFRLLENSIGLNLKREEATRTKAEIDALQFQKATDHKPGADEEYISESNFEADDDLTRETAAGEAFAPAGATQNEHDVRRAARHAGARPKIAAAARLETIVKISTAESMLIVSRRGRYAGAMARSS